MKSILSVFILLFTLTSFAQSYTVDTSSKKYYFENDIINEVVGKKNIKLPRPNIPEDSFFNYLSQKAIYPALAKKNFLDARVSLSATINTEGKIIGINLKSDPYQLFDTAAIKLIMSTNNKWNAGTVDNKKTESEVTIHVIYNIEYINNKVFYVVRPFINSVNLLTDSASNFPAILVEHQNEDNIDMTIIKSYFEDASKILIFNPEYGTVSLGFNIDTNGSISDLKIVNSINAKLDSAALNYIRATDKKWIPAVKNGIKRNSYKEFDIMYYQIEDPNLSANMNFGIRVLSHKLDYNNAKDEFEKKDYKRALTKLNAVSKYLIHNPEVFYYRGLTYINLDNTVKGCEDLTYAKYLAEQYGYPLIMDKEKIETFLKSSCGEE